MHKPDSEAVEPTLDLDAIFAPLGGARGLVLAVSGGADSTALMHLAARWRRGPSPTTWVAAVDHGLRPGSDAVAAAVVAAADALGLPSAILPWIGEKPRSGIQEAARAARYTLLVRFAEEVGASHIVTAHTRDDQAETVLTRLAAGSGPAGLAGMRRAAPVGGLVLARPFLGLDKAILVALCRRNGWAYIDDPANRDSRFARARWRSLAPTLAAQGLTARRLARLAERAARADQALEGFAALAATRCRREAEGDGLCFDAASLLAEADEIVLRVIGAALKDVGAARPVRLNRLERLLGALRESAAQGRRTRRTLHGCLVEATPEALTVRLEPPRRTRD